MWLSADNINRLSFYWHLTTETLGSWCAHEQVMLLFGLVSVIITILGHYFLVTLTPLGNPSCKEWQPQLLLCQCCAASPLWPLGPASCQPPPGAASTALHTGPDLWGEERGWREGQVDRRTVGEESNSAKQISYTEKASPVLQTWCSKTPEWK